MEIEDLEKKAINSAIEGNWDIAIKFNKEIIKRDKKNIDAHLRIAFAYMQKGDLEKAKVFYLKAKKIQPENYIIEKNIEKIKILESKKNKPYSSSNLSPYAFLDIPGKTKSVSLINCGQKSILAGLTIGQEVFLNLKKRKIEVITEKKEHIGYLPDDISKRLIILIKAGSRFKCYIKEADIKNVTIFIKEEKRGKKVIKYAPFQIKDSSLTSLNKNNEEINEETDFEEISDIDLEKLADSIINEEKDYINSYENIDRIDEENEEE